MHKLPETASPLYAKVKTYVLDAIGSGAWPRNRRVPSENELVSTLGVSRMTVHRALRELTADGHLLRIQGVGTFIAPPRPQSTLIEINNIGSEIEARGHVHRCDVLFMEPVVTDPPLTEAFEFATASSVYHSLLRHFEDEVAVQIEERFVNPELVPGYLDQDFSQVATYDYLVGATPITEVEHIITAVAADAVSAELLGLELGAPCLLLHRRTWTGSKVATVNRLTYAGGRYSLGSRYVPKPEGKPA
jgi:GntR family transcriptional regulator, histidine utilization repressor